MNNKTIIEFGFRVIWRIIKASVCVIHLSFALADNTNGGLDNSPYQTQPHSVIVNYFIIESVFFVVPRAIYHIQPWAYGLRNFGWADVSLPDKPRKCENC